MITLSTHVLDAGLGRPAEGVPVQLEMHGVLLDAGPRWSTLARDLTDADGRIGQFDSDVILTPGTFRLTFGTGEWFEQQGRECFYPEVVVTFSVPQDGGHFHVPLLLSAYAYSTYRGS